MNDETNQLLRAVLNRLEEAQAEDKANFDLINQNFVLVNQNFVQVFQRLDRLEQESARTNERLERVEQGLERVEQSSAQTDQRIELIEQRIARLFERIKTLEEQMLAIGFEIKADIADLTDKITRLQVDIFAGRADAARAIVAINDLEKRVAALEADRRAA